VVGATHVQLEQFTEPSLRLCWPASTTLRGALIDGRPAQPISGDGWISLAITSEPIPHRISLHWESRSGSSLSALARVHEQLPVPLDATVNSFLVSVAVPPGFRLWAPAHFTPLDALSFARLCNALQSADHKVSQDEIFGVIRTASADAPPEIPLMGRLDVGPADATLSAWAIDTFWLRVPLAAAVFALIAIAAAHPSVVRAGGWLLHRGPWTLASIGAIWWFCLAPRAVGPLLLVIALAILIVELRRRPAHSMPSTIHVPGSFDGR
jgi:hypothetical protein